MKRRFILISTLSTITLALVIFCFGVWASMSQTFVVSNTIGFSSSTDIYVSIFGKIINSKQTSLTSIPSGYETIDEYYLDNNLMYEKVFTEQDRIDNNSAIKNWAVGDDLEFLDDIQGITFEIRFENYSDKSILIEITDYVGKNSLNANISNTISEPITLDGYVNGYSADSGIIRLNTRPKSRNNFNEQNDFVITISVVE